MGILHLDEVKTMLQISVTTYDDLIWIYIASIEEFVKTYCNNDFADGFNVGLKLAAVEMIKHRIDAPKGTYQSESIGNYSFTQTEYTSLLSLLSPYVKGTYQ